MAKEGGQGAGNGVVYGFVRIMTQFKAFDGFVWWIWMKLAMNINHV